MERTTETRLSAVSAFWAVLVRPRRLFTAIAEGHHRGWWLAALVIIVATVLPIVVAAPIMAREAREAFLRMQEEMQRNMPPGAAPPDVEQAAQFISSPLFTVIFPAAGMTVAQVLGWLIWAGALYLLALVFGGRVAFGRMFQVTVWASIPEAVRGLVQTLYITLTGQLIRNPGLSGLIETPAPDLSTAMTDPVVMDPQTAALRQLLQTVDIFLFWQLALLILGMAVLTKFSLRRSAVLVILVWAVFTALSLVPTLVSQWFLMSAMGTTVSP